MNERMLELAQQAGLKKEHGNDREYIGNFEWRMFGELLVREVLGRIQIHQQMDEATEERVYTSLKEDIKEHFGVK